MGQLGGSKIEASSSTELSVRDVVHLLKSTLEKSFPAIEFRGEIHEISRPSSGHIYLTLKDEEAQIRAVMWKSDALKLRFNPSQGLAIRCVGRPTIYPKSGSLQLVLSKIDLDGEGYLRQKFLELKAKLEQEGLFALERKRTLPPFPKAIGIITSRTGAVLHDMIVKVKERFPSLPVYLVDVRVQGDGAADEIAAAISLFNTSKLVDVIIVARGGGSLEDLWAFNEEKLVRAVFASLIPIVSGVGHETDITLCDLVADLRAPTPTAAAEYVVPSRRDFIRAVDELTRRLKDTDRWMNQFVQSVDELGMRLERRKSSLLSSYALSLQKAAARLATIEPSKLLQMYRLRIENLSNKIISSGERNIERRIMTLDSLQKRLTASHPTRILSRGFSLVRSEKGIVRSYEDVSEGDTLSIQFAKGGADSKITKVISEKG